jgi:hypothetical protein
MIKHHKHNQGKWLIWAEVQYCYCGKETVPINPPIILEIEYLIEPINLLLRVALKLRKQLLKTLKLEEERLRIVWFRTCNGIIKFFEFIDPHSLPKIFELWHFDLFEKIIYLRQCLPYFRLGVVAKHSFPMQIYRIIIKIEFHLIIRKK